MAYKKKDNHELMREIAPLMNIGLQMVLPVLIFIALGYWLDEKFATKPWLLITGAVFGIVVSIKSLMDVMKKLKK